MIYTSYFSKYRGNNGIAISNSVPSFYISKCIKEVSPQWSSVEAFKNGSIAWEAFAALYRRELSQSGKLNALLPYLEDGVVLLCWEKDSTRCHRSILAEVLRERGYDVEELCS